MDTSGPRAARFLLILGGLVSAAMAAYHFALPYQFGWARFVEGIPPVIRWALFSINFFFSFLLLMAGLLVLMLACSRRHAATPAAWVIAGVAAFWAVNLGYQLVNPMPLPASMMVLRVGLPAYALTGLLLHAVPLVLIARITARGRLGDGKRSRPMAAAV